MYVHRLCLGCTAVAADFQPGWQVIARPAARSMRVRWLIVANVALVRVQPPKAAAAMAHQVL